MLVRLKQLWNTEAPIPVTESGISKSSEADWQFLNVLSSKYSIPLPIDILPSKPEQLRKASSPSVVHESGIIIDPVKLLQFAKALFSIKISFNTLLFIAFLH